MSHTEPKLLANALDALDRLFDRECDAVDVEALLFATSVALGGSRFSPMLEAARVQLEGVRMSEASGEERYRASLKATDDLRRELAKLGV